MQIRLASDMSLDSIVDGPGLRITVWAQGCAHDCKGCHNTQTHDFNGGMLVNVQEIADKIIKYKLKSGVTFSGGDPMYQPKEFTELAKLLKEHNINIWCYTCFRFEKLNEEQRELLKYIDVLVDGKFNKKLFSYDLMYRGSSNQRIIDINKTLKTNSVVLLDDYGGFIR